MFQNLKKGMAERGVSARSVTAIIVFGAIALVFIFFGLPNRLGAGMGAVATVNGAVISVADFQKEEQRITEYMSSLFGGSMDLGPQRNMLRQQAIESLVQSEVIHQATQDEGILAPDAEIRDVITKDIAAFQKDGRFEREFYSRYLEMTRSSEGDFENRIRKELKANRLRNLFETALRPNNLEDQKLAELRLNRMNVQFARINEEELKRSSKVSDSEVKEALSNPEVLKKAQAFFEANPKEFSSEEEVHAQHILIMAKAGDQAAAKKALEKANSLFERAKKEDFGKLAKAESEDPGSKDKGGDLGYFSRGRMVKEFEDMAFSAPVGQVSSPVRTNYGYHLIKVLDKKEARKSDFAQQKEEVVKKFLAKDKVEQAIGEIDKALSEKEYSKVDAALKSLNVAWDETGFFDIGSDTVPKINPPTVSQAVFELSNDRPWLDRLVREANEKYVLKLKEMKKVDTVVNDSGDEKAKREQSFAQKRRGDSAFKTWLKIQETGSKVSINPEIFKN